MPFRRTIVLLCVLLGLLAIGWLALRHMAPTQQDGADAGAGVTVDKEPENFASRTFDPANPPAEMPPMVPGEEAVCDSDFISNVSVKGEPLQTDATHALVTITQVEVTLQLNITIWAPADASQHVIEHEEGHRQISEYYYQTADKIAERIAATYIGKKYLVSGADLNAESSKFLQQTGTEITDEYNAELDPGPTQLRYDDVTDHSRNDVAAADAVAQVLNDKALAATPPADADPGK
ncbi:MAG: hypothetical protein WBF06_08385 [Candidatus Acidiferrales bacterium]